MGNIKRVLISERGAECPHQWWYNFVESIEPERWDMSVESRIKMLNTELMNWSAQMWQNEPVTQPPGATISHYRNVYLDFYDDHAYHWFILRWA